MNVCPDYEDLFKIFNTYGIKYLIVGGQAAIFYSEPRYTKDMDILVPPEINDPSDLLQALKEFGAPLRKLTEGDFKDKNLILQIGVPPVRIDLMMSVPGIGQIKGVWKRRKRSRYGKTPIFIIAIDDLIRAKKKANRPLDRIDLEKLVDRRKTRK